MHRFDVRNIKQRKTTKVIKLRGSAWIWRQNEQKCWVTSQTIQNNANLQNLSKYNELHRFDVKNIKQRKTTKVIKLRWIASIWRQNDELRPKKIVWCNVPNHSKQRKTTKVIKLRWIAWIWRQNDTKMLSYVPNHSKQLKPTKVIKLQWIASIWCQKHQTTQNYKSDQITMKCMDLTSKRTKMLSYVANHSKQRKCTKVIKVQWIASIWCQNDKKCWVTSQTIQNNSNLQK